MKKLANFDDAFAEQLNAQMALLNTVSVLIGLSHHTTQNLMALNYMLQPTL